MRCLIENKCEHYRWIRFEYIRIKLAQTKIVKVSNHPISHALTGVCVREWLTDLRTADNNAYNRKSIHLDIMSK